MNKLKFVFKKFKIPIKFIGLKRRNYKNKLIVYLTLFISLFSYTNVFIISRVKAQTELPNINSSSRVNLQDNKCDNKNLIYKSFTLDQVPLEICTPFLPRDDFFVSPDTDVYQIITSVNYNPYNEFTINSIPYGLQPTRDNLPISSKGSELSYTRALLQNHKDNHSEPGPFISIFNRNIQGNISIQNINVGDQEKKPTIIIEWNIEAGNRNWLIRIAKEVDSMNITNKSTLLWIKNLQKIKVTTNIFATTKIFDNANNIKQTGKQDVGLNSLKINNIAEGLNTNNSYPSWWLKDSNGNIGDCDKVRDSRSKRLGDSNGYISLFGIYPCGTDPISGTIAKYTSPNGTSEEEWQCAELSHRFLYQVYGVNFYSSNGSQVVDNYQTSYGGNLVKIHSVDVINDHNKIPRQGDVISTGSTTSFGHTVVVVSSNIINGTGSITTMEQNDNQNGKRDYYWSNWLPKENVTGWLHDPSTDRFSASSYVVDAPNGGGSINLHWNIPENGNTTLNVIVDNDPVHQNIWLKSNVNQTTGDFTYSNISNGHIYRFQVKDLSGNELSYVIVKGKEVLTVSKTQVNSPETITIFYKSSNGVNIALHRIKNGVDTLIGQGISETKYEPIDMGNVYDYVLKDGSGAELNRVTVNTIPLITADNTYFNIQGIQTGTVTLTWGAGGGGGADLYKKVNNETESVLVMNPNGYGVTYDTIEAGNTYAYTIKRGGVRLGSSIVITANGCVIPTTSDWNVYNSCTTPRGTYPLSGNIDVLPNIMVNVRPDTVLDVDFFNKHILVEKDGGINIIKGGTIK